MIPFVTRIFVLYVFDLRHFKNYELPWIDYNALRYTQDSKGVAIGEKDSAKTRFK
jgi:hypothetical protein